MRLSLNNFVARVGFLQRIVAEVSDNMSDAPKGKLRVSSSKGTHQFYLQNDIGEEKYLSKSNMNLIRRIAQKEYYEEVVKSANSELTTLKTLVKKYEKGTVEDIYDMLAPARRELVEPIVIPDDEFVRRWLAEPYEKAGFDSDEPVFLSSKKLRVRSKSEIIFADKYDEYNIPYKYECPLYLEGYGWVWPDFTALKIRYRQIVYHEHLGMMDDPEYAERNVKKIRAYEDNGFVIGKDLILSFETKSHPIGPADAERMIRNYLL
ncbi:MAG: hypothetical protein K6D56_00650 [Clostridia bacterium]|nr:hypothetical protein [Clostridia bacterium]